MDQGHCLHVLLVHNAFTSVQAVARERDKMLSRLGDHLLSGSFLLQE